MRVRLFIPETLTEGLRLKAGTDHTHYIKNVLRLKSGDKVFIFNEEEEFESMIIEEGKNIFFKLYTSCKKNEKEIQKITVCFANLKNSNTAELLNNCTQVGVFAFIPLITKHTINHHFSLERGKKIIIEASEQCGRISTPKLQELCTFEKLLTKIPHNASVVFADEKADTTLDNIALKNDVYLFIGPEGGFAETERNTLASLPNCTIISLGKNILRAETAATCASFLLKHKA